jgi:hypothetical protein
MKNIKRLPNGTWMIDISVNGKRKRWLAASQEDAEKTVRDLAGTRYISRLEARLSEEARLNGAINKGLKDTMKKPSLEGASILGELLKIKKSLFGFPPKEEERLMCGDDVATLLSVPPDSLGYLRKHYALPYIRIGKLIRYEKSSVKRWVEKQKWNTRLKNIRRKKS